MENFAVKSESFALYEAFKKDVEKIGWKYCSQFNEFKEHNSRDIDCLYFSNMFIPPYGDICSGVALFSFADSHNWRGAKFSLETQYGEALAFAKAVWEKENFIWSIPTPQFGFSGICSASVYATRVSTNTPYPHLVCPYNPAFYDTTYLDFNYGAYSRYMFDSFVIGTWMGYKSKPKPKFNVGEWVRDITNGEAYKVLSLRVFEGIQSYEIVKGGYIFEPLLEKWIPKKGEYISVIFDFEKPIRRYVCIVKEGLGQKFTPYAGLDAADKLIMGGTFGYFEGNIASPATPSEIALLDSKLAEQGKRFDKEKCELVDIYKPKFAKGDVVRDVDEGRIGVIDIAAKTESDFNVIRLSDTANIIYRDYKLTKIGNSL